MNISELARRLRVSPKELQVLLPKLGFDVGARAIKIEDRAAQRIIREWPARVRQMSKEAAAVQNEKAAEEAKQNIEAQKTVTLPARVNVRNLAELLKISLPKLMQELIKNGILMNVNEPMDFDTAASVADDFGIKALREAKASVAEEIEASAAVRTPAPSLEGHTLSPRAPVVVIMGHVDHGKTKLLDAIRTTNVAQGEAGGITQHIGAYQAHKNGRLITFLDTPGHEAFVSMRSRGARVADVAVLVVAADDGVQPQTIEALRIIQAAKLPFVVAMNKIDKPDADQEKVKRQLTELQVVPEEWGGKTICIGVSAKAGTGIDALLETVLLVADLEKEKLMTSFEHPAQGTVIESHRDSGEGNVATVLLQVGTLRVNDSLAVGNVWYGKVRAMRDFQGVSLQEGLPSQPVKLLGLRMLPEMGMYMEVKDEHTLVREKPKELHRTVMTKLQEENKKPTLCLMVKADVVGSLEAMGHELEKLRHAEVDYHVVSQAFGDIRESDIAKAKAEGAYIIGFNVTLGPDAEKARVEAAVEVFTSKIIYEVYDAVKAKLQALLPPRTKEVPMGRGSILKIFKQDEGSTIIGVKVIEGTLVAPAKFRVWRKKASVARGELKELRLGTQSAQSAGMGQEIGMKVKVPSKLTEGDMLEFYQEEKEARTLV